MNAPPFPTRRCGDSGRRPHRRRHWPLASCFPGTIDSITSSPGSFPSLRLPPREIPEPPAAPPPVPNAVVLARPLAGRRCWAACTSITALLTPPLSCTLANQGLGSPGCSSPFNAPTGGRMQARSGRGEAAESGKRKPLAGCAACYRRNLGGGGGVVLGVSSPRPCGQSALGGAELPLPGGGGTSVRRRRGGPLGHH